MKDLCLAYYDHARYLATPPAELQAITKDCPAHDAELKASGHLLFNASLAPPEATVTIRPAEGQPRVTDGPYTEAKEMVGGFFMVEAADMPEAVRIASKHPAAHLGQSLGWAIEVRQVDFFDGRV